MTISRLAAAALAALSLACARTPAAGKHAASPGPAAPAARTEPRQTYRPPADARVKPEQVERYLAVWKHVPAPTPGEVLKPTPFAGRTAALGDVTDAMAPDVKVARDQGWNTGEYLWVRERILEAEAARTTAKLNGDVLAMLTRTLAELKSRAASAPDQGSRTLLNEQIASFSEEAARVRREAGEREPESVRANMRALEPFRGKLDAIRDQIDRVYAVASGTTPPRRVREARTPKP